MKKRLTVKIVLLALFALLAIVSCTSPEAAPTTKDFDILNNDLAEGSLEISHQIPGEKFIFHTEYRTDYDSTEWRITDSKAVNITAWIEANPEIIGATITETQELPLVLVEHVHIDTILVSEFVLINGVKTDTMDDKIHAGDQAGFLINDEYPYTTIFLMEGMSKSLEDGWDRYIATYSSSMEEIRLTEQNLVGHGGVYGSKIQVVYDLLIKYPGEEYFHTLSVLDEFIVPVSYVSPVEGLESSMIKRPTDSFSEVNVIYD